LTEAAATREDGERLVAELRRLLGAHRDAGSALASRLLDAGDATDADVWLVEPVAAAPVPGLVSARSAAAVASADSAVVSTDTALEVQPNRNRAVA
jgi:hypothetical protein